jgi:hypothetical protein
MAQILGNQKQHLYITSTQKVNFLQTRDTGEKKKDTKKKKKKLKTQPRGAFTQLTARRSGKSAQNSNHIVVDVPAESISTRVSAATLIREPSARKFFKTPTHKFKIRTANWFVALVCGGASYSSAARG